MNFSTLARYLAAACLLAALGCSSDQDFHLEGDITYQGQPIPAGEIIFAPDTSQGNRGPGCMARIANGRYETARGKGHVGGPYVLTINAFDGHSDPKNMLPDGHALFSNRQLTVDLPKKSSEMDFDILRNDQGESIDPIGFRSPLSVPATRAQIGID